MTDDADVVDCDGRLRTEIGSEHDDLALGAYGTVEIEQPRHEGRPVQLRRGNDDVRLERHCQLDAAWGVRRLTDNVHIVNLAQGQPEVDVASARQNNLWGDAWRQLRRSLLFWTGTVLCAFFVAMANDTPYGLSGSIWTRDGARALRVARAVEAGVLSVNSNSSVRVSTPFGGMKQSGFGRELGMHALEGYSDVKNVFLSTEV